jgi:hypothetical protein
MGDFGLINVPSLTPSLIVVNNFKNLRVTAEGVPFVVSKVVGKSIFLPRQAEFTAPNKVFNPQEITNVVSGTIIRGVPDEASVRVLDDKFYLVEGKNIIRGIEKPSIDIDPATKRVILKGIVNNVSGLERGRLVGFDLKGTVETSVDPSNGTPIDMTSNYGTGVPAPEPVPGPALAKPAPEPIPGPALAKPAPEPVPGPALAKPAPEPIPGPALAKPAPEPVPGPALAKPAPEPIPGLASLRSVSPRLIRRTPFGPIKPTEQQDEKLPDTESPLIKRVPSTEPTPVPTPVPGLASLRSVSPRLIRRTPFGPIKPTEQQDEKLPDTESPLIKQVPSTEPTPVPTPVLTPVPPIISPLTSPFSKIVPRYTHTQLLPSKPGEAPPSPIPVSAFIEALRGMTPEDARVYITTKLSPEEFARLKKYIQSKRELEALYRLFEQEKFPVRPPITPITQLDVLHETLGPLPSVEEIPQPVQPVQPVQPLPTPNANEISDDELFLQDGNTIRMVDFLDDLLTLPNDEERESKIQRILGRRQRSKIRNFIQKDLKYQPLYDLFEVPKPVPSVAEPVPSVTEPVPSVTEPVPSVTEPVPSVAEPVPSVAEPVPSVTEPVPSVTEPVPSVTEPVPSVTEPVPSVAEPVPSVAEPVPSVTEPVPSVTEPVPSVTEPVPSVAEPVPSVTEPVPSELIPIPAAFLPETASVPSPISASPPLPTSPSPQISPLFTRAPSPPRIPSNDRPLNVEDIELEDLDPCYNYGEVDKIQGVVSGVKTFRNEIQEHILNFVKCSGVSIDGYNTDGIRRAIIETYDDQTITRELIDKLYTLYLPLKQEGKNSWNIADKTFNADIIELTVETGSKDIKGKGTRRQRGGQRNTNYYFKFYIQFTFEKDLPVLKLLKEFRKVLEAKEFDKQKAINIVNELNKFKIEEDSPFYQEYKILFDYFNIKIGRTRPEYGEATKQPKPIRKTKPFDVRYLPSQSASAKRKRTRKNK